MVSRHRPVKGRAQIDAIARASRERTCEERRSRPLRGASGNARAFVGVQGLRESHTCVEACVVDGAGGRGSRKPLTYMHQTDGAGIDRKKHASRLVHGTCAHAQLRTFCNGGLFARVGWGGVGRYLRCLATHMRHRQAQKDPRPRVLKQTICDLDGRGDMHCDRGGPNTYVCKDAPRPRWAKYVHTCVRT